MNEVHRTDPATVLLAFLAGAVTGAAVALLTAPQSGRETRSRLKGLARDAVRGVSRATPRLNDAYTRAARAARQAFSEALDAAASEGAPPTRQTDH
ncbi:MAG TPA: YtxH domain-containing protein [Candidatus Polarisedimenticolia bacterium]|jgi:gas vesicle protein|nr:YtxH domain-containing protein [Candidatus Polarisedimenticolia bacterium]